MRFLTAVLLPTVLLGCQPASLESSDFVTSLDLAAVAADAVPDDVDWKPVRSGKTNYQTDESVSVEALYTFEISGDDSDVTKFVEALGGRLKSDVEAVGGEVSNVGDVETTYAIGDARGEISFESQGDSEYHTVTVRVRETSD